MAALTRLPLGPMLACQEPQAMLLNVMLEIVAVGRAQSSGVPNDVRSCVAPLVVLQSVVHAQSAAWNPN